jgi:cell wall-associated NlpC family hydrolase
MQEAELGRPLRKGEKLRRGDLVFWEGHVGIMTSGKDLLHANAFHMAVEHEPYAQAKRRIREASFAVRCVRRLPGRAACPRSARAK